jgi:dTDP-4-dehydrorhamnose reductase
MALTYTWKINGLKKQDNPSLQLNDIIIQTYWECIGTDEDGNSGTFNGATPFNPDQVDINNFTTYENLTENQVLDWIKNVVGSNTVYKAHIDEQIQKQINVITNSVVAVDAQALPWAEPSANTSPPTANT